MGKSDISAVAKIKSPSFFYGYAIIAAGFFIQAVAWGTSNSFGVFFDSLINEFGWSRATISGAASLCFLVHGVSSIFLGNLNDRFGPRIIMSACGFFLGLGLFLMTTVNSPWQLYLFYGLIAGIGLGGMDVIPLSTVTRWFEKKRGMMSGIIKVGTGVGMFIMPFFITWLLKGYGWRTSFAVLSVIIMISIICLAQFLVRNPIQKAQFIDNTKHLASVNSNTSEQGLTFKEAVRTRQLWTVCAIYFIILICVYTILIHIVQHAIDLGIPVSTAAGILAIVGGVSISGRFLMGGAGDRIGEKSALVICLLTLLTALVWLQAVKPLWMFYVFATIYGFAHGGFFSLVSPLIARLFGTKSHGILFGMVIFCSTVGGAIGPFVAGYIFDITHSYKMVFLILAVLCIIALALTASLTPLLREKSL
ncbi:MAG: MFS transporter [Proteobacteria bacterium]|nr:MFS transporter [Pseudomonadota bacterium]MBU1582660.1 MFS transporter [Pseudomonadota bacterium]MBU2451760.1 MFS transporter [Pseudomonadota bacterium]MBU2630428.1 MFS transporter [Pseudomonadota bacterium]